jgi:hypothetical protein
MQEIRDDLKAIRQKLDVVDDKISTIDKYVAINTQSLSTHIARTEANEHRILYLERIYMGLAAVGILGGIIKLIIA